MRKALLIFLALLAFSGSLHAAETIELNKANLEWSNEGGKLTITLTADTKGWLSVGLGTTRMDGAVIFIGYDKKGEQYFEEHLGSGHSHKKTDVQRPVDYEVTESNGTTMLKFSVNSEDFIKTGQTELPFIVAYGSRDNFTSMHRYRDSGVIRF